MRVSSTLLPTNSSGVPKTEITNASIAITATNLDVSDVDTHTKLDTLNGKITKGNDSSLVAGELQQVLIYGKDSVGDLHVANVSNTGDIDVEIADFVKGQFAMSASFPVVIASDQSSIPVSMSTTISGTQGNLSNAVSVISGDVSSEVDVSGYANNSLYISSTTSDTVNVHVKGLTGSTWVFLASIYPMDPDFGSNNSGYLKLDRDVIHSVRLSYTAASTVTASVYSRV